MVQPALPKDVFLDSLDRCTESDQFVRAFYRKFMSSSDEVRKKFAGTDFELQNKMLVKSLRLVAEATVGHPAAMRELKERAETHDRHHLNIGPWLYQMWLTALVETAAEFDQQWSLEVEDAWNECLKYAIDYMVRRY